MGIVCHAAEAAQLQRALVVRQQQAFFIIHQALRDTAQDPASICSPGDTVSPPQHPPWINQSTAGSSRELGTVKSASPTHSVYHSPQNPNV